MEPQLALMIYRGGVDQRMIGEQASMA